MTHDMILSCSLEPNDLTFSCKNVKFSHFTLSLILSIAATRFSCVCIHVTERDIFCSRNSKKPP